MAAVKGLDDILVQLAVSLIEETYVGVLNLECITILQQSSMFSHVQCPYRALTIVKFHEFHLSQFKVLFTQLIQSIVCITAILSEVVNFSVAAPILWNSRNDGASIILE